MTAVKVKVIFDTAGNAWHGMPAERLWATPVGISLYRLENSPLYAYGISYQDVVVAREDADGSLRFVSVRSRGGHSTYRVVLKGAATRSDFAMYWKPIEQLGCTYESSRDPENVFAIDVPPSTDVYDVYSLLENGERDGVWEFEEAYCGHPLRSQMVMSREAANECDSGFECVRARLKGNNLDVGIVEFRPDFSRRHVHNYRRLACKTDLAGETLFNGLPL